MLENQIPNNLMRDNSRSIYYTDEDLISGISNKTPKSIGCITYDANNTYVKEFIMNDNVSCPVIKQPYSKEDLQNYRDKFFDFRSHIWQQSADVDPVDRINEKILSGNGDLFGSKSGKKISNIYDSLTGDRIHKKHCMAVNLDNISTSQYKIQETLNDYYTKNNWMYNSDCVSNNTLFDDVSDLDSLMDRQMIYN
jgi:hypothetical protein